MIRDLLDFTQTRLAGGIHIGPREMDLSVHNHGPVIPSDRMSNLLLPFERATTGVDKYGRSIGLVLYIVQQVVEAHVGDVTVESTAEAGKQFTVRMKRYR